MRPTHDELSMANFQSERFIHVVDAALPGRRDVLETFLGPIAARSSQAPLCERLADTALILLQSDNRPHGERGLLLGVDYALRYPVGLVERQRHVALFRFSDIQQFATQKFLLGLGPPVLKVQLRAGVTPALAPGVGPSDFFGFYDEHLLGDISRSGRGRFVDTANTLLSSYRACGARAAGDLPDTGILV